MSIIISKTVKTVIRCCKPDKTIMKCLTNLYISCDNITNKSGITLQSQLNEEDSAVAKEFLNFSPGLADLLELMSKDEDEIVGETQDIIVTRVVKKTTKKQVCKDDVEDDDDEEEVVIRPSRSTKFQAKSKMKTQIDSNEDDEESDNSDDDSDNE
jgi:hypothetical protein